jgi:hypothetical protein
MERLNVAIEDGSSGGDNAIVSGQFVVRKILLLHVKHLKLKIEVQRWTFVE